MSAFLISLLSPSFPFLNIFSAALVLLRRRGPGDETVGKASHEALQWGGEKCGPKRGYRKGPRKGPRKEEAESRCCGSQGVWRSPFPLPLLLLSHFLPLLQAQTSLELASSVGDCPRSSAHTSWPQSSFGVMKRPWKSLAIY